MFPTPLNLNSAKYAQYLKLSDNTIWYYQFCDMDSDVSMPVLTYGSEAW